MQNCKSGALCWAASFSWRLTVMNAFEDLTDEDIEAILFYIEGRNVEAFLW